MLKKMRRHGDSIALTKGLLIAVRRLCRTGPALSVIASQCHLSQGGEALAGRKALS